MKKFDRTGSGPWFYVAIIVLIYLSYCAAIAVGTSEDCGKGAPQDWQWIPPKWECTGRLPGYG